MEVNETNVKTIKTSELVEYLIKNYTKNSDSFKYVHTFDKMQIKMFPYLSEKIINMLIRYLFQLR